ncbi:MAG: DUF2062 domain-containing protein [Bacteroidales bacterium]|nr:DUF2062 domain-containing protein [Bacteroidales bacterium]
MDRFDGFKACVIIPTYNNQLTLAKVIRGVLSMTAHVIVVNDGSTDDTREVLSHFPQIQQVDYQLNKGKGHALLSGFKKALELGYEYAVTIDSDGQHKPEELTSFLDAFERNSGSLVVGDRNLKNITHLPSRNSFANKFSNFWFNVQTGLKLTDTQTGYRLYPLHLFKNRKYFSVKYEFELEVLVRAAWQGVNIVSIPIDAYYPPPEERVTHFRPFRDFMRISVLNFVLTTLAIVYFLPRQLFRKYRKKKIQAILFDDIIAGKSSRANLAVSIGFGFFMGILPVWGYQLLLGFTLAHLFKLNKTAFFLAANISIPPLIPFVLYLSYVTGSFILGEGSWHFDFEMNLETIKTNLFQYLIGSITLAVMAGFFFGILSYLLFSLIKIRKSK